MADEIRSPEIRAPSPKGTFKAIGRLSLIAIVILGFVYLVTRNGCDNSVAAFVGLRNLKVDTWAEWGDQISGVDLFKEYNAFSVSFEPDSIRVDFVRHFHPLFVEQCANTYLAGTKPDDNVVQELVRLKMIGVRNDGTILHIANQIGIDIEDRFLEKWSSAIEEDLRKQKSQQSNEEFLIYGTISSMFKELVLHGPDGRTQTIKLAFNYGK